MNSFEHIMATLDYPMCIVTTCFENEKAGCLVGFSTQCSILPQHYLVCISKQNYTLEVAKKAQFLTLHFPSVDQIELAKLFGETTGDNIDKFSFCPWYIGPYGAVIIKDDIDWFIGKIIQRIDLGDHVGHLLEPVSALKVSTGPKLGFQEVKKIPAGHPIEEEFE